jgi:hypothetical protein
VTSESQTVVDKLFNFTADLETDCMNFSTRTGRQSKLRIRNAENRIAAPDSALSEAAEKDNEYLWRIDD